MLEREANERLGGSEVKVQKCKPAYGLCKGANVKTFECQGWG